MSLFDFVTFLQSIEPEDWRIFYPFEARMSIFIELSRRKSRISESNIDPTHLFALPDVPSGQKTSIISGHFLGNGKLFHSSKRIPVNSLRILLTHFRHSFASK